MSDDRCPMTEVKKVKGVKWKVRRKKDGRPKTEDRRIILMLRP